MPGIHALRRTSPKHPMQKIIKNKNGIARFQKNKIVRFLLDAGPFDLNRLACMGFDREDQEQFAQLIGYSVRGFSDLSYASPDRFKSAAAKAEKLYG